jgi:hypothetical protein
MIIFKMEIGNNKSKKLTKMISLLMKYSILTRLITQVNFSSNRMLIHHQTRSPILKHITQLRSTRGEEVETRPAKEGQLAKINRN